MMTDTVDCPLCGKHFGEEEEVDLHKQQDHPEFMEIYVSDETFNPSRQEVLDYIRSNPYENASDIVKGLGWDGAEDTDVPILSLYQEGKLRTENGGYVIADEAKCEDCGEDFDSGYVLDKHQDVTGHEEDLGWSDDQGDFTDKPKAGKYDDRPVVQGEPVGIVGEIEKQEDKPLQSHDDWLEDLKGLKDEYSYKDKGEEEDYEPSEEPIGGDIENDQKTIGLPKNKRSFDVEQEDNQIYSDDEIEAHKKTGGTYPASWLEQANKMVPEDAEEGGADEPLSKVQDLAESLERDWNRLKTEQRAGIFENLGVSQGNSITLANLSWNNLTGDLKKDASEAYAKEQQELEPKEVECEICGADHETDNHDEVNSTESYIWAYDIENNHSSPDFKKKASIATEAGKFESPEECPFCKSIIHEPETLDWHMEQEHGAHVSSQFTQTGVQNAMADANFDRLDDYYGEVKKILATEDYIPAPYDQHFEWVASMDQDDYRCKHCGKWMYWDSPQGSNALHTAPVHEIIPIVRDHLATHGITESYAKEDWDEKYYDRIKTDGLGIVFKCKFCGEWVEDYDTQGHLGIHDVSESYAKEVSYDYNDIGGQKRKVTYTDNSGQQKTGNAVMKGPAGWVVSDPSEPHGGNGRIVDEGNFISVESKRKAKETVPPDNQVIQDWWQLISEAGGEGDYMSMAMIGSPDNSPNWESGDPIMWEEFSSSQQQALISKAGGIGGMIERLMNEGWSDYNDEDEDSYESISRAIEEEPEEKWDKDDDIGRNYAEPTGDDEPLDDDSYWQGRDED